MLTPRQQQVQSTLRDRRQAGTIGQGGMDRLAALRMQQKAPGVVPPPTPMQPAPAAPMGQAAPAPTQPMPNPQAGTGIAGGPSAPAQESYAPVQPELGQVPQLQNQPYPADKWQNPPANGNTGIAGPMNRPPAPQPVQGGSSLMRLGQLRQAQAMPPQMATFSGGRAY